MRWKVIALLCLVVLAGSAALFLTRGGGEPVPAHRILQPRRGTIARGVIAIGRVEPRTRIEIKSKANGIIRKLLVDVNQKVKAGQVIAELDRELLEARVAEAEGKLSQALAEVEKKRAFLEQLKIQAEDPELAFAERNWLRVQQLHKDEVVSDQEHDVAEERFEKARYRLQLINVQKKSAEADIEVGAGRVQEVRALADLSRQELDEARIVSPIDGVVLYRYLEEGDAVSSIRVAGGNASIIMTLGDLSELYVEGEVDEVDVGQIIAQQRVRPNLVARVTVDSFKERTFLGRVARITPLGLEDANGIVTFEVRILLENPENLLLANMTANALIVLEEKSDVLLLSQGAVLAEGDARYVVVYDPVSGSRERRQIEIGISDGSQVEVADGLSEGQRVLIP